MMLPEVPDSFSNRTNHCDSTTSFLLLLGVGVVRSTLHQKSDNKLVLTFLLPPRRKDRGDWMLSGGSVLLKMEVVVELDYFFYFILFLC